MIWRYYRDKEYGHWVAITEGKNPTRKYYETRDALLLDNQDINKWNSLMHSPEKANSLLYIGEGGQWRLEPVRKPNIMREGMHIGVGAFNALLMAESPVHGVAFASGFALYEITEGLRLRDWAYRDLGGHLVGFAIVSTAIYWDSLYKIATSIWPW